MTWDLAYRAIIIVGYLCGGAALGWNVHRHLHSRRARQPEVRIVIDYSWRRDFPASEFDFDAMEPEQLRQTYWALGLSEEDADRELAKRGVPASPAADRTSDPLTEQGRG